MTLSPSQIPAVTQSSRRRLLITIILISIGIHVAAGLVAGITVVARQFAAASLNLRYRRLFKAAGNIDSPEAMHRLRICAKKLRYLSEFFAGLYPRHKVKRFISSLGVLQEELGAVNDAATCRELVAQADAGAKPLGAEARGVALGWIAAGGALAEARARGAIKAPMDADPYWK